MKGEKGRALILNMKDAMEKHRWIESEKAGKDLGEESCLDWAENHSDEFLNEFREHEGGNLPENLEGTHHGVYQKGKSLCVEIPRKDGVVLKLR